ncbi:MAG: hypothetical protein P8013_07825 [Candidatus Sulfobium sp.]|jgi:hypothetical protein
MSLQKLAEGIILQSIEDLWNENYREDSITFFKGKDFELCAEMAGMKLSDQVRLLNLVRRSAGSMEAGSRRRADRKKEGTGEKRAWKKQPEAVVNYT